MLLAAGFAPMFRDRPLTGARIVAGGVLSADPETAAALLGRR